MDKKYEDHGKQFGFKKNASCQHAIHIVKSVAEKYKRQQKMLLICALDFSKAFDKVNRVKLFTKLHKVFETNNIDKALWLSLYSYYLKSLMMVRNKNDITPPVIINRGVKQGGPMSPRLYSVYAEVMLNELE